MRGSLLLFLPLAGVLALTACVEWHQPGVSSSARNRDLDDCMALAARNPVIEQLRMGNASNPLQGFRNCRSSDDRCEPGRNLASKDWPDHANDPTGERQVAADAIVSNCMKTKGYTRER